MDDVCNNDCDCLNAGEPTAAKMYNAAFNALFMTLTLCFSVRSEKMARFSAVYCSFRQNSSFSLSKSQCNEQFIELPAYLIHRVLN